MRPSTHVDRLEAGCCCHRGLCLECPLHGTPERHNPDQFCDNHADQATEIIPHNCQFDPTED